jgi:hypothetical protein
LDELELADAPSVVDLLVRNGDVNLEVEEIMRVVGGRGGVKMKEEVVGGAEVAVSGPSYIRDMVD